MILMVPAALAGLVTALKIPLVYFDATAAAAHLRKKVELKPKACTFWQRAAVAFLSHREAAAEVGATMEVWLERMELVVAVDRALIAALNMRTPRVTPVPTASF